MHANNQDNVYTIRNVDNFLSFYERVYPPLSITQFMNLTRIVYVYIMCVVRCTESNTYILCVYVWISIVTQMHSLVIFVLFCLYLVVFYIRAVMRDNLPQLVYYTMKRYPCRKIANIQRLNDVNSEPQNHLTIH